MAEKATIDPHPGPAAASESSGRAALLPRKSWSVRQVSHARGSAEMRFNRETVAELSAPNSWRSRSSSPSSSGAAGSDPMTPDPRAKIDRSSGLVAVPLAAVGIAAPIVLERRYRLLVDALARLRRSRRGRWSLAAGSGATMVVLAFLAARHFATSPWPLSGGEPGVLVAVCLLMLLAQGFKAWGWGRLFTANERPRLLALAAGNGGAALTGVVLPGRFDDAMRIAVVRRYPGCRAGIRALCLSLVMLGLIDSVALAPLAAAAAVLGGGIGVRAGLTVVAVAGVAAAVLLVALPRLAGSKRALRFRLGRWLSPRTTSRRRLSEAWALVSACWLLRALATFLLLGTLGVGFSFPLALLLLCAGAAAAAVPVGLAGTATQVGAGAAALIAAGVGGSQALAVTLAGGALGVFTGAAIFFAAIIWRAGLSLATSRIGTSGST